MCGRYLIITNPDEFRRLLGYPEQPNFPPRYNVAPTQPVPIVRRTEGERHFALVRWGLMPPWVKDPKNFTLLINARGESAHEKPSFKNAMKRRRCLIPADGFYEWKGEGAAKRSSARPWLVRRKGGGALAFAGLWDTWSGPNGEEMESCAIVTVEASPLLQQVHHRMPVMLRPEAYDAWLDCDNVRAEEALSVVSVIPDAQLETYPVSPAVNRVANDGPEVIAPYTEPVEDPVAEAPKPRVKKERKADERQASLF
jgi:putative SOS response-associated peptidase YedK